MEEWRVGVIVGFAVAVLSVLTVVVMWSWPHRKRQHPQALQYTIVFALLVSLGIAYGCARAAITPRVAPPSVLGVMGQAEATVTTTYTSQTGATVYLVVTRFESGSMHHQLAVRARWRTRLSNEALTTGDEVLLSGVLGYPPPLVDQSSSTIPLQPPTYTFTGQIRAEKPAAMAFLVRLRDGWLGAARSSQQVTFDHRQLAASIVFGAEDLNADVKNAFLAAGLLHVLAASGANILLLELLLMNTIYPLWRFVRLPFWLWSIALIGAIWLFAGMCAFQPSIVRAAIMATYRSLGMAVGRRAPISVSLAVAATAMIIAEPTSMLSPSAWLSFMATGAISTLVWLPNNRNQRRPVTAGHTLSRWGLTLIQKWWGWCMATIRTTVTVELWVAPLVLVLFHQITPYSLVANILCEPLIALVLPTSLAWLSLSLLVMDVPFVQWLLTPAGFVEDHLLGVTVYLVTAIARMPGSLWTIKGLPSWYIILYYMLLTILRRDFWNWFKFRKRQRVTL